MSLNRSVTIVTTEAANSRKLNETLLKPTLTVLPPVNPC